MVISSIFQQIIRKNKSERSYYSAYCRILFLTYFAVIGEQDKPKEITIYLLNWLPFTPIHCLPYSWTGGGVRVDSGLHSPLGNSRSFSPSLKSRETYKNINNKELTSTTRPQCWRNRFSLVVGDCVKIFLKQFCTWLVTARGYFRKACLKILVITRDI